MNEIIRKIDHKAFFRFMNLTNNKPVLNRGVFEWK